MKIEDVVSEIYNVISERYERDAQEDFIDRVISLCPTMLDDCKVLRIKRRQPHAIGLRTILLIRVNCMDQLKAGIEWSASVREELLNEEVADLYLFVITDSENCFPIETCINIEASDKYCRKYITRPTETINDFINRTFLCVFGNSEQLQNLTDPLKLALIKTSDSFSDFDDERQEKWRQAFLSGKNSFELADIIFDEELKEDLP